MTVPDRFAQFTYRLVGRLEAMFASFAAWLGGEPVVVHYLGALAVTVLARWGVHLSPDATVVVGMLATSVAAWAARRKVYKRATVEAHGAASYVAGKTKQARPKLT